MVFYGRLMLIGMVLQQDSFVCLIFYEINNYAHLTDFYAIRETITLPIISNEIRKNRLVKWTGKPDK